MLRKVFLLTLTLCFLLVGSCFAKEPGEQPFYIQDGQLGPHYIYKSEIKAEEIPYCYGAYHLYFVVNILLNDKGKIEMQKSFNTELDPKATFMYCHIDLPKEGDKFGGLLFVDTWECYFEDENGKGKIGTGRKRDERRDIRNSKFWQTEVLEVLKIYIGERTE